MLAIDEGSKEVAKGFIGYHILQFTDVTHLTRCMQYLYIWLSLTFL